MTAITFDTLSSSRRLRDKGLSQEQAEAIAQELQVARDIDMEHLATKTDLRELELRMTIRLGGMIMALGGVLIAVKYLG
jgi:hypothetical protein